MAKLVKAVDELDKRNQGLLDSSEVHVGIGPSVQQYIGLALGLLPFFPDHIYHIFIVQSLVSFI